jgi:cytochrome b
VRASAEPAEVIAELGREVARLVALRLGWSWEAPAAAPVDEDRGAEFDREVIAERARQDRRWGTAPVDAVRMVAVLTEEVGEVARAVLDENGPNLAEELVQVAASARKFFERCLVFQRKGEPAAEVSR